MTANGNNLEATRTITKDGEAVDDVVFTNTYIREQTDPGEDDPTSTDPEDTGTAQSRDDEPRSQSGGAPGKVTPKKAGGVGTGDPAAVAVALLALVISAGVLGRAGYRRRKAR